MTLIEYDKKLSEVLKLIRNIKGYKQLYLATKLGIDRTSYSRIENGHIAITSGQLREIAIILGTSNFQILAMVDAIIDSKHDYKKVDLETLIVKFFASIKIDSNKELFSEENVSTLIDLIKVNLDSKEVKSVNVHILHPK
jgi:transcriptional regulator with XRE-family HTH domain